MTGLLRQQIADLMNTVRDTGEAARGQVGTMQVTIFPKSGVKADEPLPEPFPPDPGSEHDDSWWR